MIQQTVFPFKLETTKEELTVHRGLTLISHIKAINGICLCMDFYMRQISAYVMNSEKAMPHLTLVRRDFILNIRGGCPRQAMYLTLNAWYQLSSNLMYRGIHILSIKTTPPVPIRAGIGQASCLTASCTEAGCLGYFKCIGFQS